MQNFKPITAKLFPANHQLIDGADEIFELNFALWEYENLNKQDLIKRSAYFKSVDGIGWYVRKNDLKRMVGAYDDVFTFHKEELNRFKELISTVFNK